MKITLDINNRGEQYGTVGWLAKYAASIRVGMTVKNKRAIWLKDHDGDTMCMLAMQDPYDLKGDGPTDPTRWVMLSACGSGFRPSLGFATTPACLESLENLADEAVSMVQDMDLNEQPLTFTIKEV